MESTVTLVTDPRSEHAAADRVAQQEMVGQLFELAERMTFTVESIANARDQARDRVAKLETRNPLRKRVDALASALEDQRKALVASKEGEGISGEEKLREEIGVLYGNVNSYEGRPTESQRRRMGAVPFGGMYRLIDIPVSNCLNSGVNRIFPSLVSAAMPPSPAVSRLAVEGEA